MKNKKKLRSVLNITAIFLCSFLVVFLLIKDDFPNIVKTIGQAKWIFIIIAVAFQSVVSMIEGLMLMILTRRHRKDYTYKEALINHLVGLLFCFITPSATGGQFAQAYVHSKQDISVEKSASTLVLYFVSYELMVVLYCFITLVANFGFLSEAVGTITIFGMNISFIVLAIIGFAINLIGAFGILILSYSKVANKFVNFIVRLLTKIKIFKNGEDRARKIDSKIYAFRQNLSDLKHIKPQFFLVCILNIVKLTINFIIPFLCALALGVDVGLKEIIVIIALSSYLLLITTYIPIPGSSGGSEFFFYLLFAPIFGSGNAELASAMIIWRTITFYLPLLYCGIVLMVFNRDRKANMLDFVPTRHLWFFYPHLDYVLMVQNEGMKNENREA